VRFSVISRVSRAIIRPNLFSRFQTGFGLVLGRLENFETVVEFCPYYKTPGLKSGATPTPI